MSGVDSLSTSLFGFNKKQVQDLANKQANQIEELKKELNETKDTVQSLKDELSSYKDMEQELRDGIVDARKTGTKIIAESESARYQMLEQTNEEIIQYKEEFANHSRELYQSGINLKDELNRMKNQMTEIVNAYQDLLEETDFESIYPAQSVERLVEQVDLYEASSLSGEEIMKNNQEAKEHTISEEDQKELANLIDEVIANEKAAKDDKVVEFKGYKTN